MDHSHLPTINFLCDVNSRVRKVREEQGIGSTLTARLRAFEDEVQKHRDNKIKETTLIKRGSSFLAQFPDLLRLGPLASGMPLECQCRLLLGEWEQRRQHRFRHRFQRLVRDDLGSLL
jgi:hypothetical protein